MQRIYLFPLLAALCLLIACGGASQPQTVEVTRVILETENVEIAATAVFEKASSEETAQLSFDGSASSGNLNENAPEAANAAARQQTRQKLIIKNGEMTIATDDPTAAVNSVANLAAATGGYIISQRVWEQNEFTYATLRIGVPVTEFERAMASIRQLGRVIQDIASGEDVTDEFVDLGSRLQTLEITQERLQTFLAEAKKIEDIIKLNSELTKVEEQINVTRGRMNYLADRAAFSTINVQIDPVIPEATPTPIPEPQPWTIGTTATTAARQLQNNTRSFVDFMLYNSIVCGPWLLLIGLGLYFGLRLWLRLPGNQGFSIISGNSRSTPPVKPENDDKG